MELYFDFYKNMFDEVYPKYLDLITDKNPNFIRLSISAEFDTYIQNHMERINKYGGNFILYRDMIEIFRNIIKLSRKYIDIEELKKEYSIFRNLKTNNDYYIMWILEKYFKLSREYCYVIWSIFDWSVLNE